MRSLEEVSRRLGELERERDLLADRDDSRAALVTTQIEALRWVLEIPTLRFGPRPASVADPFLTALERERVSTAYLNHRRTR